MEFQLLAALKVYRESFIMEDFIGSSDIFALVLKGSFVFEAKDGRHTVNENEGALFRKNTLYHRSVVSPVTMYLFRYSSQSHAFPREHIRFKDKERIRSTLGLLEKLDRSIVKDDFACRCSLFCDICTQYALENCDNPSALRDGDPLIEAALAEINGNIHKKIAMPELCALTSLSYPQFMRRFKTVTGMAPSDYISARRIQKAKRMLSESALSVRDIAYACGFENEYYFSNFFKKHTSLSPSAFRKSSI